MQTKLPSNLEAERSVLGAMMRDSEAAMVAIESLSNIEQPFYEPKHERLYKSLNRIISNGLKVDGLTLSEHSNIPFIEIAEIIQGCYTTTSVDQHCQILIKEAAKRKAIKFGNEIQKKENLDDLDIIAHLAYQFSLKLIPEKQASVRRIDDFAEIVIRRIEERKERNGEHGDVETGFIDLDRKTGGMDRKDMVVLAARPSEGKSALAANIALNLAKKGKKVLFFSIEMPGERIVERLLCGEMDIAIKDINNNLDKNNANSLLEAVNSIHELPLYICDDSNITTQGMLAKAERFRLQNGEIDLIIVDYLQFIRTSSEIEVKNRYELITELSRCMKDLAKRLNAPIMVLSQLSRAVENKDEPDLSDLRESGAIEQDADQVWFLYRKAGANLLRSDTGKRILKVAKHRNGETGYVNLMFAPDHCKFYSCAQDHFDSRANDEEVPF